MNFDLTSRSRSKLEPAPWFIREECTYFLETSAIINTVHVILARIPLVLCSLVAQSGRVSGPQFADSIMAQLKSPYYSLTFTDIILPGNVGEYYQVSSLM